MQLTHHLAKFFAENSTKFKEIGPTGVARPTDMVVVLETYNEIHFLLYSCALFVSCFFFSQSFSFQKSIHCVRRMQWLSRIQVSKVTMNVATFCNCGSLQIAIKLHNLNNCTFYCQYGNSKTVFTGCVYILGVSLVSFLAVWQ